MLLARMYCYRINFFFFFFSFFLSHFGILTFILLGWVFICKYSLCFSLCCLKYWYTQLVPPRVLLWCPCCSLLSAKSWVVIVCGCDITLLHTPHRRSPVHCNICPDVTFFIDMLYECNPINRAVLVCVCVFVCVDLCFSLLGCIYTESWAGCRSVHVCSLGGSSSSVISLNILFNYKEIKRRVSIFLKYISILCWIWADYRPDAQPHSG